MRECGPKLGGRLPDRIVEVRWAFADRPVKLGGDEAWLALHEDGIVRQALRNVRSSALSSVNTFTSTTGLELIADLPFDREGGVERAQQRHD